MKDRTKYFSFSSKSRRKDQDLSASQETKDWTWSLLKVANEEINTSSFISDNSSDDQLQDNEDLLLNDCIDNQEKIKDTAGDILDKITWKLDEFWTLPDPRQKYKEFKKAQDFNTELFQTSIAIPYHIKYGEPESNKIRKDAIFSEAKWMSQDFRQESILKRSLNYSISHSVKKNNGKYLDKIIRKNNINFDWNTIDIESHNFINSYNQEDNNNRADDDNINFNFDSENSQTNLSDNEFDENNEIPINTTFPIKNKSHRIEEAKDFITLQNPGISRENIEVWTGPFSPTNLNQSNLQEKGSYNHEITHFLMPNMVYPELNDQILKKKIGDNKIEDYSELTSSPQPPLLINTKQASLITIDQLLAELDEINERKKSTSRKRARSTKF